MSVTIKTAEGVSKLPMLTPYLTQVSPNDSRINGAWVPIEPGTITLAQSRLLRDFATNLALMMASEKLVKLTEQQALAYMKTRMNTLLWAGYKVK
jgi:hypothetical protein